MSQGIDEKFIEKSTIRVARNKCPLGVVSKFYF